MSPPHSVGRGTAKRWRGCFHRATDIGSEAGSPSVSSAPPPIHLPVRRANRGEAMAQNASAGRAISTSAPVFSFARCAAASGSIRSTKYRPVAILLA